MAATVGVLLNGTTWVVFQTERDAHLWMAQHPDAEINRDGDGFVIFAPVVDATL